MASKPVDSDPGLPLPPAAAAAAAAKRPGPWPPRIEPLPADHDHNPKVLRSWARRTGFKSSVSGDAMASSEITNASVSVPVSSAGAMSSSSSSSSMPKQNAVKSEANGSKEKQRIKAVPPPPPPPPLPSSSTGPERKNAQPSTATNGHAMNVKMEKFRVAKDPEADVLSHQSQDDDDGFLEKRSHVKYEVRDNPGLVPLIFYGIQHYLSISGSIILIPLIIVPAMGGSDEDTARVVSTVLLVTGFSTLMHSFLGSRLPLVQGASFVYLAPALTIINSTEFQSIGTNRFKHTMRELQGAVILASAFHSLLGYSGLMSILLRLINPVVITPTVAAVGLAFFSYGFPVVGSCVEIGIPQILVVIFFSLYLRKISVFGHRVFQVYAVPLGLGIIWAYAFLLTAAGAYNFGGCNVHVPLPNIVSDKCRKHVLTMMHCRTDVSVAMQTADWFRIPYPLQWGIPVFRWKSACIMIAASVIASIDSVGSYHASSLLVATRAPTPGVVSRAIGLEGLTSVLAGLWGIGTGATTLTENVHTIAVTKMGSRRAVGFGACILILMSLVGKIGAFIASIPQVIVAALLCVMWSMLSAFGLSNLRYSETGSSRNVIIVGLSLFLSLSVPAYFQHYTSGSIPATVASYFQPYTVAAHGPVKTGFEAVDFVLNSILSMNMVVAFLVAFVLDNTVPGSRHERGTYVWTKPSTARRLPDVMKDYSLPPQLAKLFVWARWVGL